MEQPEKNTLPQDESQQPVLLMGPDAIVIPDKYTVERGIIGNSEQEAVVIVFIIQGHEIRFALAPPNANNLADSLQRHATEAKDFFKT